MSRKEKAKSAVASPAPPNALKILVTGGAGFIGSNFVQMWLEEAGGDVLILDKGTYAAAPGASETPADERGCYVRGDIADRGLIKKLLDEHRPLAIVNFAAETHVDRSILFPEEFVHTNVLGTFNLLEEARAYWSGLPDAEKSAFRFLQVSTDEVYGSLPPGETPCTEARSPAPNSPYAASKAAADQFVRAFHQTYGLPTQIARCCNNYGPFQHPEKLIPHIIHRALREDSLPIYGDGQQIRDWLYVDDHCAALRTIIARGRPGEVYNIGSRAEKTNLEVVRAICSILDRECPRKAGVYSELITHVTDRPGHDRRYALNASKLEDETGWRARESFATGLEKTVRWYLTNVEWVSAVADGGAYRNWVSINYNQRR